MNEATPLDQPLFTQPVKKYLHDFGGMKVLSVTPGGVTHEMGEGWGFYLRINTQVYHSRDRFIRPSIAKQKMREEMYRLRRIHLPT